MPPIAALENQLVRGAGTPEVYLVAGGAKFYIDSPAEVVAMGRTMSEVVDIPMFLLNETLPLPRDGAAMRERDKPEVYVMCSGQAVHVPTGDALVLVGLDWGHVRVLPANALSTIPKREIPSQAATPPSMVFGPNQESAPGTRYARTEFPGITLPNGVRVVEVRGWLRSVDADGTNDPDWHYQIEPDVEWLESRGVSLSTAFKVGDCLMMGANPFPIVDGKPRYSSMATTPTFHVELNGWRDSQHPGRSKPADWHAKAGSSAIQPVTWPFQPLDPAGAGTSLQLSIGSYVRMSGSLVTDPPHINNYQSPEYNAAASAWQGSAAGTAEDNPARWTEIHPPDLIEVLPAQQQHVSARAVVVEATPNVLSPGGVVNEITVDLYPPGPKPPNVTVGIAEFVSPYTRYSSIVEGSADLRGAAIAISANFAQVHVKVKSDGPLGASGKFMAIYRMWWK